ncbi:MAG: NUDIX hydrolase [Candidatus Algichlamydia australiensis]|nr:NUDIX hydrolase [Chlamydiales bacterium]
MNLQAQNSESISIFEKRPKDFTHSIEIVAAYVKVQERLLFMKYTANKGSFWSVPGGKIENGETAFEALKRELKEETGIEILNTTEIKPLNKLYIVKPGINYISYPFQILLKNFPSVIISDEHDDFVWKKPLDAVQNYPILPGAKEALIYHTGD